MSFKDEIRRFTAKVQTNDQTIFVNTVAHAYESIVNGSPVTGAPGQPVGQYGPGYHKGSVGGALKASWTITWESPTSALIGSGGGGVSDYNQQNEDGVRRPGGGPYEQRSTVGGRHSVKLTIAGLSRIVEVETAKVAK